MSPTFSAEFKNWLTFIFEVVFQAPDESPSKDDLANHEEQSWEDEQTYQSTLFPFASSDIIAYLIYLFSNAAEILAPYSNEQASEGLQVIISNNRSDTMYALLDESVSLAQRQRCIQSMVTLFTEFFRVRCSPELSFPPERSLHNPLNFVSLYWFDLMPIHGRNDLHPELNQEFLNVFRRLLATDSDICREGALPGLGSWRLHYPEEADEILDHFLQNTPDLNPQLREHALLAKRSLNIL